jgi:nickel transport protein
MRVLKAFVAAVVLFAAAQAAQAHGIWLAERWGKIALVYGHGAGDDPYDPAKISAIRAFDEDGKPVEMQANALEDHALLSSEGEPAIILVDFDNGFYTKGSDGKWVNRPKSEVEGARKAGRYFKHTLTIRHLHGDMPSVPEQPLQILPLANPAELSAGKTVRVRVLFDGKPLAGVFLIPDYVNMSDEKIGETDAAGEVDVTVRNNGLNVIAVSHGVPLEDDPDADTAEHFATLAFEVGDGHAH